MEWFTFAQGTSFSDLTLTVEDQELPKGTPVRFVMDLRLPVGKAFDLAGAEAVFRKAIPEGLILKDVYGDGNWKAVIECESDPAFLAPIVAFVAVNWKFLVISTVLGVFVLTLLVSSIRGESPFTQAKEITKYLFAGALVVAGIILFRELKRRT